MASKRPNLATLVCVHVCVLLDVERNPVDEREDEKEAGEAAQKDQVHLGRRVKRREGGSALCAHGPVAVGGGAGRRGRRPGPPPQQRVGQGVQVGGHVAVKVAPDLPDGLDLHPQQDNGVLEQSTWVDR